MSEPCLVSAEQMWPNSRSRPLFGPSRNLFSALRLTTFIESTQLYEEVFSQMKINISKRRSRLTNERSKYCLDLCIGNCEPSFSKSAQGMRCYASTFWLW